MSCMMIDGSRKLHNATLCSRTDWGRCGLCLDAERQRAGFKAPVSARTDERAARMLGSAQSGQRAAGSARVRRCQRACLGRSEGPLAGVIYAGRLRSVHRGPNAPTVTPGHPGPKFLLSPARDPLNPKKAMRSPDPGLPSPNFRRRCVRRDLRIRSVQQFLIVTVAVKQVAKPGNGGVQFKNAGRGPKTNQRSDDQWSEYGGHIKSRTPILDARRLNFVFWCTSGSPHVRATGAAMCGASVAHLM